MRDKVLLTVLLILGLSFAGCDSGGSASAGQDTAKLARSAQLTATAPAASSAAAPSGSAALSAGAATSPKPKLRPTKPLNVIVIVVDAMRGDMPWQGYDRPIAPHLTKLAGESVTYPRAYSVSSYTAKSIAATLSGRYPSTLYRDPTFFTQYPKSNLFFPKLLQEKGIRTMAIQAHKYFERFQNFQPGFDVWQLTPGITWNAKLDENVTGPQHTDMAIKLLEDKQNTSGQFFMWLHYMDPHDVYKVHEGVPKFGNKARDRYDGEIYFTDMQIRRLLDFCEKQPWWENTALIVTGDHGEAFGEHKDYYRHGFTLWNIVTHVPLMIKGPGIKPRRINQRRSHIDLAPTLMDLMGQPPSPTFVGKSMVAELYGAEPDDREPIMLELPADTYNPPTRAIIKGDFKLIEDPGPRFKLYYLPDDPGEFKDLAGVPEHKAKLEEMMALFERSWQPHEHIAPYGNRKLVGGGKANGPLGPPGWTDPDTKEKKKK